MKKSKYIAILFLLLFTMGACHRSTCPTYDSKSGEQKSVSGKKGKTKSGVLPKGMN